MDLRKKKKKNLLSRYFFKITMKKEKIYEMLDKENIWYEANDHVAIYNMSEQSKIHLPYPDCDAKNLFLRDDKKRNYYLVTIQGSKKINLKDFAKQNNTKKLSFVSVENMKDILDLNPGEVSPFGLLNDKSKQVIFMLDSYFVNNVDKIGVHPNDNTATVWLKVVDLLNIVEKNGSKIKIVEV